MFYSFIQSINVLDPSGEFVSFSMIDTNLTAIYLLGYDKNDLVRLFFASGDELTHSGT
jgi:hypothetical protein